MESFNDIQFFNNLHFVKYTEFYQNIFSIVKDVI